MKKALKISLQILLVLLTGIAIFVFIITRPSGKLQDYAAFLHNDTLQVTAADSAVKVTFLGVSTLLIDDGQTQLLIDGFFSRPSLAKSVFLKTSTDKEKADEILKKYQMNRVKGVFVTHSHYDHSFDVGYVVKKCNSHLYGSVSTLNIGRGDGLKEDQMSEYELYKELTFGNLSITVLPSKHSEPKSFNNDIGQQIETPLSQPAKVSAYTEGSSYDFLVKYKNHIIYIKPSANYISKALDSLQAEVLFLGAGGLGDETDDFKENYYNETVGKLKPSIVIPVHWDNFFAPLNKNLEMFPVFGDKTPKGFDFLISKTQKDHIQFSILDGGSSIVLFR